MAHSTMSKSSLSQAESSVAITTAEADAIRHRTAHPVRPNMEGLAQQHADLAQQLEGLRTDNENPAQAELLELRTAINTMRREM